MRCCKRLLPPVETNTRPGCLDYNKDPLLSQGLSGYTVVPSSCRASGAKEKAWCSVCFCFLLSVIILLPMPGLTNSCAPRWLTNYASSSTPCKCTANQNRWGVTTIHLDNYQLQPPREVQKGSDHNFHSRKSQSLGLDSFSEARGSYWLHQCRYAWPLLSCGTVDLSLGTTPHHLTTF